MFQISVHHKCKVSDYSQDWECVSVVSVVHDDVWAVTLGLEQQVGRKIAFAAGLQWPAWSSAGPVPQKHIHVVYEVHAKYCMFFLFSLCMFKLIPSMSRIK